MSEEQSKKVNGEGLHKLQKIDARKIYVYQWYLRRDRLLNISSLLCVARQKKLDGAEILEDEY